MNSFILPYTVTEQEYIEFNEHYIYKTPRGKKLLLKNRLMCVFAVLVVVPLVFIMDTEIIVKYIQLVGLFILALISWFLSAFILKNSTKRSVKKMRNPVDSLYSQKGQLVFDFENRIITDMGERAEVRVFFDNVTACYETLSAFYLYYSSTQAIIVPYRIFRSVEELNSFRLLVHSSFRCES